MNVTNHITVTLSRDGRIKRKATIALSLVEQRMSKFCLIPAQDQCG